MVADVCRPELDSLTDASSGESRPGQLKAALTQQAKCLVHSDTLLEGSIRSHQPSCV